MQLIPHCICQLLAKKNILKEIDANQAYGKIGQLIPKQEITEFSQAKNFSFIKEYFDVDRSLYLVEDNQKLEREKQVDFKKMYIEDKSIEKGNIAHYYLSFIKYNTDEERKFAAARTISFYGGLLPELEIKNLIKKVDEFIEQKSELFSEKKWNKIFTEYTIFNPEGQEYRLDRLMIDEQNKEILIIDYKTGEIYDEKQVENYKEAVKSLNVVKENGYQVNGRFEEIEI